LAFGAQFEFVLGGEGEHAEHQAAFFGVQVEALGQADDRDASITQVVDGGHDVGGGAAPPVGFQNFRVSPLCGLGSSSSPECWAPGRCHDVAGEDEAFADCLPEVPSCQVIRRRLAWSDRAAHAGRAMHEDPFVPNEGRPGHGLRLRPGLVIAIEPITAHVDQGRVRWVMSSDS
jgi:hypothetical protein